MACFLRAGVAKGDITTRTKGAQIHDPLYAKALVLDDGTTRLAIIAMDVVALQCVTVGDDIGEYEKRLFENGEFTEYLFIHGIGVQTAEALAEMWHKRVRQELGFGSEDDPSIQKIFQQKYRGSRYSFGYPACPNLEDRTMIMELLQPRELGVELSENYMLVPEQSTDAIIAHHPQAKYFDV